MQTLSWARHPVIGSVALALLLTWAQVGFAGCDPSTGPDKSDMALARVAVAANCDCATATSHGAYVSCAAQQADAVLANKSCRGRVKKCASKSTCGKPGFVTCCRTSSKGKTSCSVKRAATGCTAPKGGGACVGTFSSCCDACTANGCSTAQCAVQGEMCSGTCGFGLCQPHCVALGGLVCVGAGYFGNCFGSDSDCVSNYVCTGPPSFCGTGFCQPPCPPLP